MRIRNAEILTDHGNRQMRSDVVSILEAGMTAADPYYNTLNLVRIEDGMLRIGGADYEPWGAPKPGLVELDLNKIGRIFVFGAGKGIQRVAEALEKALGDRLIGGHIIIKHGDMTDLRRIGVTHGGHPVPDENCVEGSRRIVEMIREINLTEADVVFTIVGNGVSSLLTRPAGGLSLESVKEITRILQIEKGAMTLEVNNVRNAVDSLKSGRITRMLQPAKMFHLLTIDCNQGSTGDIEGYRGLTEGNYWLHTLPDYTSRELAIETLHRHRVWDAVPAEVRTFLQSPRANTEPLGKDEFERMDCRIYGLVPHHLGVLPAAMTMAAKLGYVPHIVSKMDGLAAAEAGRFMAAVARLVAAEGMPFSPPCALFMTGEKVVQVGKSDAVGGRNQEFCLAIAESIKDEEAIAAGAVDTDGTDGPGGNFSPEATCQGVIALAGGVVDGFSHACASGYGFDLKDCIDAHATSKPLWDIGDGIWAVHSISVNDLSVVLIGAGETAGQ